MRVLVLAVLMVLSVSGVEGQAELPPYIHYFDHLRGGLVIERADGTDSRMIPDVPMDAGPPVWSPSGKWMVVGNEIISTDGSKRIEMPERTHRYDPMHSLWSEDDILLTTWYVRITESGFARLTDPERNETLAEIELNPFSGSETDLYWSADGERAFVGWRGHVAMLHVNGQTNVRVEQGIPDRFGDSSYFFQGRLLYTQKRSDERWIAVIEEIDSGRRVVIGEQAEQASGLSYIDWSPTLMQALIYERPCPDDACTGWLKLVDLEKGEVHEIQPMMALFGIPEFECPYLSACTDRWSHDGRYAIIDEPLLPDSPGTFLIDTSTGTTRQLAAWNIDVSYHWSPTGELYLTYPNDPNFYRYDPQTGRDEKIEVSVQGAYPRLFSSPDSQFIGIPSHLPTIINRTGAVVVQTFPHSYSEDARRSTYQWSPNSEWVMIDYRVTFAGGGRPEPDVGVVFDIAGTTRRELPYQGFNGFLPDRAVQYLSPGEPISPLKQPVLLLPQAGYVRAVGWHPTDPDRLVTFSADGGLIFWSLANDDPQITEQIPVEYPREEIYQVQGTLYWLPERNVVLVFKNGEMRILDPQLNHLPVFNGLDTPQVVLSNKGRVIQYSVSEKTIEVETDTTFSGRRWLASDFSGIIAGERYDVSSPYFYIDTRSGRVVSLERPDEWFSPQTADAKNGVTFLGSIYDCCIAVLNTEDGHLIDQFYGTAVSLAISADGRRLATTSAGMTAIWDISEYIGEE